jgi:hypothetical protein
VCCAMAVCLTVVQCAVSRQECLAVTRLVCFVKARVLGCYAPRSAVRAVSVLCHGCVLDRGLVCSESHLSGCRPPTVIVNPSACNTCAQHADRGSVRCVKARVLGCYAFSVLCQGKSAGLCVQCYVKVEPMVEPMVKYSGQGRKPDGKRRQQDAQTRSGPGHDARRDKRKRHRSRTTRTFLRLTDPNRLEVPDAEDEDNDDAERGISVNATDAPDLASKLRNFCDSIGFERFAECEALQSRDAEKRASAISALEAQIAQEKLSAAEYQERIVACEEAIKSQCVRTSPCAGCGALAPEVSVLDLLYDGALQTLRVSQSTQETMREQLELMATCTWPDGEPMFEPGTSPFTVHQHGPNMYHLDSAGCSGSEVQLCTRCWSACKSKLKSETSGSFVIGSSESKPYTWPKDMIVAGSDFGKPANIGLATNLSMVDRLAIAPLRTFDCIVKLVAGSGATAAAQCQSALKGHTISFPHDAPERVVEAAISAAVDNSLRPQIARHVHITFVGSKRVWGKLKTSQAVLSSITCDAKRVVQWLVALSIFHEDDYFRRLRSKFFVDDAHGPRFDSNALHLDVTQTHLDNEARLIVEGVTISDDAAAKAIESNNGVPLHSQDDPDLVPGSAITVGCTCVYTPSNGEPETVTVTAVHPDLGRLYFTIRFADGRERQTESDHLTPEIADSVAANTSPALSHVLWNHEPSATRGDDPHGRLLKEAMRMASKEHDAETDIEVTAHGLDEAVNEFEENQRLITCGFPDLFFLGRGVAYTGSIPATATAHWLNHHSGRFGRDAQLLFLLFSQLQRHSAVSQIAASVKAHPAHVQALKDLIGDPLFTEKATAALEDPMSPESRHLLFQIEKLICMSTQTVPFSAMERKAAMAKLYSMVQFYGLPSWFVTVSPSDNNSKIVMTIANQCDWEAIESREGGPKQRELVEWSVVCDYPKRAQLVAGDPVAAAQYFAAMTEAMMQHLCQLACNHVTRKTSSGLHRQVGVLGKTFAHFAALECQGRGSLHFHALIWSGLTPELLQALASGDPALDELRRSATDVLDSMVRGTVDPERHGVRDQDKADRNNELNGEGPASLESEYPREWEAILRDLTDSTHDAQHSDSRISERQIEEFVERHVANIMNYHTHSATCHKGKYGKRSCRMANPQPICPELLGGTGPVELHAGKREESGFEDITAAPVTSRRRAPARETEEDFLRSPFKPLDLRTVLWELGRAGCNGDGEDECVVPYSLAFSASSMSNTAIVPVGSTEQAKAVCFYLLKYITKDSTALENTRLLVHEAVKHVKEYPSRADDAGTTDRTTKHLLQRIVNSIAGAQEISGQMAAAALLKKPSCFASDSFWHAFVWPAVQDLKRRCPDPVIPETVREDEPVHEDAEDCEPDEGDSPIPEYEDVELRPDGTNETLHDDEEGCAGVYTTTDVDGKKSTAFVAQHAHYEHRGRVLQHIGFLEFCSLFDVVRTTAKQQAERDRSNRPRREHDPLGARGPGRVPNELFFFEDFQGEPHPLHRTHAMRLRSKRLVPILAGPPPPTLPAEPQLHPAAANRFARYMITLLCPWDIDTGLPAGGDFSYNRLCLLMHEWSTADVTDSPATAPCRGRLCRARAFWAENITRGLRVSTSKKRLQTLYRHSAATVWSESEKCQAEARGWRSEDVPDTSEVDAISALADIAFQARMFRRGCVSDTDLAKDQHVRDCLSTLQRLQGVAGEPPPQCDLLKPEWYDFKKVGDDQGLLQPTDVADIIARIATAAPVVLAAPTIEQNMGGENASDAPSPGLGSRNHPDILNAKQRQIFDRVIAWHRKLLCSRADPSIDSPPPLFILVHGPPGTGKTKVANVLAHALPCATCAPTGIAASLFLNAITLHSMFGIPSDEREPLQPLSVERLSALKALLEGRDVILMDEVSFVSPLTLNRINQRLKQIRDCDRPFGGMAMVVSPACQFTAVGLECMLCVLAHADMYVCSV